MRLDVATRRRHRLSLTSLIDVVFLLLLFFMLTSTFTRFAGVDMAGGNAGQNAGTPPDVLVRLTASGWNVNGRTFAWDDAAGGVAALKDLEANGGRTAVVLAGAGITAQQLVSTLEDVRRATKLTISVAR